jgi:septin family protein
VVFTATVDNLRSKLVVMEDQTNVVYLDQYRQRKLSEQFDRVEAMKRQHPSYKPKKEEEEKDPSDI